MEFSESLGVVLRQLRNKKEFSQVDLAAAADVERSFISDVENGRRNISMNTFLRLCEGLEVEPPKILDAALKRMKQ